MIRSWSPPLPHLPGLLLPMSLTAALLAGACGGPTWTSDSAEAVAAYERCLDARMKIYVHEAEQECRQALEADPDFVMPKLALLNFSRDEEHERLMEDLRNADLDRLTSRERFLVSLHLRREDPDEQKRLLTAYLDEHPKDPFALQIRCEELWSQQNWDEVEACLEDLLESDPNWVQAQNRLGYLELARGNFEAAEERFETYRYIAPDQANPHDSMGELLLIQGRYDEAEEAFEQALATREDFCPSYQHLILLYLVQEKAEPARGTADRMEAVEICRPMVAHERCRIELWTGVLTDRLAQAWQTASGPLCDGHLGEDSFLMAYEAAVKSASAEDAKRLEEGFEEGRRRGPKPPHQARSLNDALADYMAALRAERDGDPARAAELFAQADEIPFWDSSGANFFKLFAALQQAEALDAAGDPDGARRVREEVRATNPQLVEDRLEAARRRQKARPQPAGPSGETR